ncbi:MAG: AMP-binding protein [Elusimicrobia bacterium]|nr:AMP-binding protein [Elusimicrobiota bacterium]
MTLTELLERRVSERGDFIAYVYRDKTITFKQFDDLCNAAAGALHNLGIEAGDRFAICHRNSLEFIVTWFALAKLGAIAVHINFMCGQEEISYILQDSGSKGVLTQKEFLSKVRQSAGPTNAKTLIFTDDEPLNSNERRFDALIEKSQGLSWPRFSSEADTTAAILYTSGTMGKPKGAMLTHDNFFTNARDSITHLGLVPGKEVVLCILPIFHIFAWTAIIVAGIYGPSRVVIVESITPPKPWLKLMAKWKVTLFAAVPPVYHVLSKEAKGLKRLVLKYFFFRTVKRCVSGAAPLPLEVLKTFESKLGVPLLEGYGLTETSPTVSVNTLARRRPGTVGALIPNVEVKIVSDNDEELGIGQEGEICVKSPGVMKGYFNLPEADQECFTKDGYFITGDIGKLDEEGYLTICDRKKDMIIVKGLKVFPVQVEEVILRHPNVQDAAVVGIPVEGGSEIIKAFVTARQGSAIVKTEIQELIQANLPPYKRPREIEIRSELPKNALQKVLKRELRREAMEKLKNARTPASV